MPHTIKVATLLPHFRNKQFSARHGDSEEFHATLPNEALIDEEQNKKKRRGEAKIVSVVKVYCRKHGLMVTSLVSRLIVVDKTVVERIMV